MTKQGRLPGGLGRFGDPGMLVLLSVASGPRHGHAILLDIEAQFGIRLGPGTLYGAIAKLAERGLISALADENRRRPYEITEAGRSALEESLTMWSAEVDSGRQRLAGPVRGAARRGSGPA